jgi:acetyltransferase
MVQTPTSFTSDPAYDILRSQRQPLSAIFDPKAVAVIGATDRLGSVGRTLLWNLITNPFGGTVYPINPKRHSVMGITAYPSIGEVPDQVDLAIIATPAATVPGVIGECVAAGVKGAIILSAGFKEIGAPGIELERQILEKARAGNLRIIGPNCLGLMNPHTGMNATFASTIARPGNVGFISQSGALCTSILDWSLQDNVGFSAFVSIGSMLDVDWGDLIYYLGDDPHTESIVIYMESIGNARSFLSAAREVGLTKPIVVIKAGQTEAAAKASASHTGALTGSDEVLDAAFRRCGVLRVTRISELFDIAEVLAKQPRAKGPRLSIITNAGGPGVLATDALIATGGELAELSEDTVNELNEVLPKYWSHGNPIDILGDAEPERYAKAIEITAKDPNNDGLLVVLTPQAMTDPTKTAEQLVAAIGHQANSNLRGKPIIASWMGGDDVRAGEALLNRNRVPTYAFPDAAARVFNYMWRYSYNLKAIYETPAILADQEDIPDRALVDSVLQKVRQENRNILTEFESKQILAAYGIPTVDTRIATSADDAVACAEAIGFPVVLKLFSETITHKTDVGGVQLNLRDADAVRRAYEAIKGSVETWGKSQGRSSVEEDFLGVTVQPMINLNDSYELIIGSSPDPQFGPVLLFGQGGQMVEVLKDRAIALPPLNTTLARRLMEQTKIYKALQGVRGRQSVDMDALEQLLVRFSQLVVEQPWIQEIDINPLLASPQGTWNTRPLLALDARVVLYDADTNEADLPRSAIRSYPTQYVSSWTMKDGTEVTIRPISPEDEPLVVQFHETLSEQSVYLRYFHLMKLNQRVAHERLARICFIDYEREMALVADHKDPQTGEHQILGIARLSKMHGFNEAEFAMLISDPIQRQGLGTELLRRLVAIGRDEGLERITAEILAENYAMQRVAEKVGFKSQRAPDLVKVELDLLAEKLVAVGV